MREIATIVHCSNLKLKNEEPSGVVSLFLTYLRHPADDRGRFWSWFAYEANLVLL